MCVFVCAGMYMCMSDLTAKFFLMMEEGPSHPHVSYLNLCLDVKLYFDIRYRGTLVFTIEFAFMHKNGFGSPWDTLLRGNTVLLLLSDHTL